MILFVSLKICELLAQILIRVWVLLLRDLDDALETLEAAFEVLKRILPQAVVEEPTAFVLLWGVGIGYETIREHVRRGVTRPESFVELLVPAAACKEILYKLGHVSCKARHFLELTVRASAIDNDAFA